MTERNVLLLHHENTHPALRRELQARGLELRQTQRWQDADEHTLGAMIWFYEALRHPGQIWYYRRQIAKHGVPLLAWNQDAPHYLNRASWRLDWLDRARLLDLYATHTLIDTQRQFAEMQIYLANAADSAKYHATDDPDGLFAALRDADAYDYDVCFLGAMDGNRYKEMRARQEFFGALGERLNARGIRFLFREASGLSAAQQIALFRQSRINLNYGASCEYQAPVASGLPERCYGLPACGAFLLCDKRSHAQDDFTPGLNWAEFDGLDDCVAKIDYWLADFAAARDLAERCHRHVMSHHTYANRAQTLHEALLRWHEAHRR